jgi:hypothetical protein
LCIPSLGGSVMITSGCPCWAIKSSLNTTFISYIELAVINIVVHWLWRPWCIRNTFDTNYFFCLLETNWAMVPVPVYNHTRFHFQSNRQNLLLFYIIHTLDQSWSGRMIWH